MYLHVQVMGTWLLQGESLDEVKSNLQAVNKRFDLLGYKLLQVYTDNCCNDRKLFNQIFKDKLESVDAMCVGACTLEALAFDASPVFVHGTEAINCFITSVVMPLIEQMDDAPQFAFDSEWTFRPGTNHRKPFTGRLSTVSIALRTDERSLVAVMQLDGKTFPSSLRVILEDMSIAKIGFCLQSDRARLLRDWKVNLQNSIELSHMAFATAVGRTKKATLDLTCQRVLGLEVDKTWQVADWEFTDIYSSEQVAYAAVDAAAAWSLHEKLSPLHTKNMGAHWSAGDDVIIVDRSGQIKVAIGTVVQSESANEQEAGGDVCVRITRVIAGSAKVGRLKIGDITPMTNMHCPLKQLRSYCPELHTDMSNTTSGTKLRSRWETVRVKLDAVHAMFRYLLHVHNTKLI